MNIIEDPEEDGFLPFAIAAALNICVDYSKILLDWRIHSQN